MYADQPLPRSVNTMQWVAQVASLARKVVSGDDNLWLVGRSEQRKLGYCFACVNAASWRRSKMAG